MKIAKIPDISLSYHAYSIKCEPRPTIKSDIAKNKLVHHISHIQPVRHIDTLRNAVVKNFGFLSSDNLLFHIDEAMSWELVKDLKQMKCTLLLTQNIAAQANTPNEIIEWIEDVREVLQVTFEAIAEAKVK